jgi:hypothetical protein
MFCIVPFLSKQMPETQLRGSPLLPRPFPEGKTLSEVAFCGRYALESGVRQKYLRALSS